MKLKLVRNIQGGKYMDIFKAFLDKIENRQNRDRVEEVLSWISEKYPTLQPKIAWNQPMFTDHQTFIIGFSVAKKHMAIAPEKVAIDKFSEEIIQSGYEHSKELIRIQWDKPFDFSLLGRIIEFNMSDKAESTSFWRK